MITTDPMPLGDNNQATVCIDVHPLRETDAPPVVTFRGQVSHDGVIWFDAPGFKSIMTAPGRSLQIARIDGALLRFVVTSEAAGALRDDVGVRFGLNVSLARA